MSVSKVLRIVGTLLIVGLIVVFATRVNWTKTWSDIRHAALVPLILATLFNFVSFVLKGVRWWIFLRPVGVRSLPLALRAEFVGAALNNALVANAGEGARVIFVSRHTGVPVARILATLALERFFDLMGYVILLVIGVFALPMPHAIRLWRWYAVGALIAMVVFMLYLTRRKGSPGAAPESVDRRATGWVNALRRFLVSFGYSVRELSNGPRFLAALALSLLAWVCLIATYAYSASALHWPLPLAANVAVTLAVSVGFLLRFTPGNVGVFQVAYAVTAAQFGMPRDTGVAVALFIQTIQIIPITLLGFALAPQFVLRRGASGDAAPIPPVG